MTYNHPTFIILILIICMIFAYRQKTIFNVLALITPIITGYFIYISPEKATIELLNLELIYDGSEYNKLIGSAFIMVLFSANLYALGQNKRLEIILGNTYGAFTFFCLMAGDFLSMFVGIELMMVCSVAIIFVNGAHNSLRSAKKYFLTHLMSSNMILIGIAYLITKHGSLELVSATQMMNSSEYSSVMIGIMLTGMIMNIAAFPFSGWMVNYYTKASTTGFVYLISFTTKVSIMVLLKIFAGYEMLKYVAIIMILYACIKVIFEDALLALLCYLSIMAMGLMLLAISHGTEEALRAVVCYLFIHIIYKSLLSISFASIIDNSEIINCSDLQKFNSPIIKLGLFTGIAMMINLPLTSSLYIKSAISHIYSNELTYFVIITLSLATIYALPWKKYFSGSKAININLNKHSVISILFMSIILAIIAFAGYKLPVLSDLQTLKNVSLISADAIKQAVIIIAALIANLAYSTKRYNTNPINFTEWVGHIFFYLNDYWQKLQSNRSKTKEQEPWAIANLGKQATLKLTLVHNQQTAIFIVFTIFIIMLVVLTN